MVLIGVHEKARLYMLYYITCKKMSDDFNFGQKKCPKFLRVRNSYNTV